MLFGAYPPKTMTRRESWQSGRILAAAAATGELTPEALAGLIGRNRPTLLHFMAVELGEHEAEGATQDVLERAVNHRTTYNGSIGSPEAWLWGIARNVRSNRLGASSRRQRLHGLLILAPPPLGMTEIEAIAVVEEMQCLQPMDQRIIQLRYWEGKTFAEIAQALGISTQAARKRSQRCTRRLRRALDGPDLA